MSVLRPTSILSSPLARRLFLLGVISFLAALSPSFSYDANEFVTFSQPRPQVFAVNATQSPCWPEQSWPMRRVRPTRNVDLDSRLDVTPDSPSNIGYLSDSARAGLPQFDQEARFSQRRRRSLPVLVKSWRSWRLSRGAFRSSRLSDTRVDLPLRAVAVPAGESL